MSYTPPAGNVAHLSFPVSQPAYVPQAGYEADLSWETGVLRAKDFSTTRFGTALAPVRHTGWLTTLFGTAVTRFTVNASGFTTTAFGSPRWGTVGAVAAIHSISFGTPNIVPRAEPIYNTHFGTPNAPYLQTTAASGFKSTQLGTNVRVITNCLAFSGPPSTTFSLAYTATNQAVQAVGATTTRFGSPMYRAAPNVLSNYTVSAAGWRAAVFGTPRAPYTQIAVAQGFSWVRYGWPQASSPYPSTHFGTPLARSAVSASSVGNSTVFGAPRVVHAASPWLGTMLGTPSTSQSHTASPFARRSRFGLPTAFLGGHRAFGFTRAGRFGRPRAASRTNRTTAGWLGGGFGTPAAMTSHRVALAAPTTAFGTAILKRNPEC